MAIKILHPGRRVCRDARHSSSRTPSSSSVPTAPAKVYIPDRRNPHPDSSRFWPVSQYQTRHEPAFVRQAVSCATGLSGSPEQEGARAARCPPTSSAKNRREVPRSAAHAHWRRRLRRATPFRVTAAVRQPRSLRAAQVLRSGGLVAFPPKPSMAWAQMRATRMRWRASSRQRAPAGSSGDRAHSGIEYLQRWAREVPALRLDARAGFLAGPLTLILEARARCCGRGHRRQDTVGLSGAVAPGRAGAPQGFCRRWAGATPRRVRDNWVLRVWPRLRRTSSAASVRTTAAARARRPRGTKWT